MKNILKNKKKAKSSTIEEHVKNYIVENGIEDLKTFVNDLRNIADYYEHFTK